MTAIAKPFEPKLHASDLDTYDTSETRPRHMLLIRTLQKLKPYSPDARTCFLKAMVEAGKTKEDLADLINVALDELTKNRFELPPFALLDKAAHHVRAVTIRGLYRRVYEAIPLESRVSLDALFTDQPGQQLSPWELLNRNLPVQPLLICVCSSITCLPSQIRISPYSVDSFHAVCMRGHIYSICLKKSKHPFGQRRCMVIPCTEYDHLWFSSPAGNLAHAKN